MRLLVTGTGRTGTWWLTHALRSCGIDAQHEVAYSIDRHGEGDWTCEISWLAAPYTPIRDAYVVHLVRHPLDTIRSRAAWGSFEDAAPAGGYDPRPKGRWAIRKVPRIANGRKAVERAAIHWVEWNRLVKGADERLRIEDVSPETVRRLARLVDHNAGPPTLPQRSVNASRPSDPVRWSDVSQVDGLVEMAAKYGYVGGAT